MSSGTRPPSVSLSWHALFSLPMRICSPPPAASRVRSCKVTPLVKVTLDDVLNKRHLPPLTLKDFEEWLVFVEGHPQYLYFILWLKEYESRYSAWISNSGCAPPVGSPASSTPSFGGDADPATSSTTPRDGELSYVNLIPSSAPLALFFTRAKQTFLDPASSSPYTLCHEALASLALSTHSRAPSIPQFTMPEEYGCAGHTLDALPLSLTTQPHPHPRELAPLAIYARKILKDCLERFAQTACQNVGTRRAWCGIAGGTFLMLVMGILPALTTLFFAPSRWWRASGWFGCWLGGTIVVSSFHGICMMIYIFGDLRQLRSFELARPAISGPRVIARARPKLKSFFTREGQEESGMGDTGSGTGTATGPAPAQPLSASRNPHRPSKQPTALHITDENKSAQKLNGKYPLSAGSASQTSTGTPIMQFGPGAFRFGIGTGTAESDTSATTGTDCAGIVVGETDEQAARANEDDFGIEISPVYYYSGHGPALGEEGVTVRRTSMHSAGSGSRIGLVMRWVLGRRGSVDTGLGSATETGTKMREKATSILNGKTAQLQSQVRSHTGTFGIRSWRGGLGSLQENSGAIDGFDLEKCLNVTQTAEDDKILDDHNVVDDDGSLELENMLTAEFITHDYPELEVQADSVLCANQEPTSAPKVEVQKERPPLNKKRESSFVSPVKFDFDKLPAAAATRRMSYPCTFTSVSLPPCPIIDPLLTPPQPSLLRPPPALYSHPEARLATPSSALSIVIPRPRPLPPVRDRQWWDTCPRHPTVEAALSSQTFIPSPGIQTHNHTHTTIFVPPVHPNSMLTPADRTSTRRTSLTSSDVHSRMRVNVHHPLTASERKSTMHPATSTNPRSSETWRMRFRRVMAVPAFGPLTRVLEPIVSRGQWEIVVRSACVAAFGAWIFIGCLIALPEVK